MGVRVVILGLQELNRYGLRAALQAHSDLDVVADAGLGPEALAHVAQHAPDVVVLDTVQPCRQTSEVARSLVNGRRDCAVLVVANEVCDCAHQVFCVGAAGLVLKHVGPAELANAVRSVASGYAVMPAEVAKRLCSGTRTAVPPELAESLDRLSSREREVLVCLAEGSSNAEIALRLRVGQGTVKSHVQHLLNKLGLRDRVQAVIFAYESGFLQSPGNARPQSGGCAPPPGQIRRSSGLAQVHAGTANGRSA